MSQSKQIKLISHKLCPYVQRAVIALEELGIEYQRIDIELNNKPSWFTQISPLGKVPVMVIDDDIILFESAVIAEYINDIGGGRLLDRDPLEKARQRAWIEFASASLNVVGQIYNAKTEQQFVEVMGQLSSKWNILEKNIRQTSFWMGEQFSLVDAAFAPLFRYFDLFEKFDDFQFVNFNPKVSQWREALAKCPSVVGAVSPDYLDNLADFVIARDSYLGRMASVYQINNSQQDVA